MRTEQLCSGAIQMSWYEWLGEGLDLLTGGNQPGGVNSDTSVIHAPRQVLIRRSTNGAM